MKYCDVQGVMYMVKFRDFKHFLGYGIASLVWFNSGKLIVEWYTFLYTPVTVILIALND